METLNKKPVHEVIKAGLAQLGNVSAGGSGS